MVATDKIARGSKVTLTRSTNIYIPRTKEELDALRREDVKAGRYCDSAGEPILYGPYSGWGCKDLERVESIEVQVTGLRGEWKHWHRKPKGLTVAFCTTLNREILFTR
jgi:hypothetical protein